MPRQELHSESVAIQQKPDILDPADRDDEIVQVERLDGAYADALRMAEEWITIILNPSHEKNAATTFPVWVNGKGAEVMINGRPVEMAWLPIGREITIRRKYVEVIARAKIDQIETAGTTRDDTSNTIKRITYGVHSFSVMEDSNPKGRAWLTEILRRNF